MSRKPASLTHLNDERIRKLVRKARARNRQPPGIASLWSLGSDATRLSRELDAEDFARMVMAVPTFVLWAAIVALGYLYAVTIRPIVRIPRLIRIRREWAWAMEAFPEDPDDDYADLAVRPPPMPALDGNEVDS